MELVVLGLNHRTAPLEMRERVAYDRDEALRLFHHLTNEEIAAQCLLLSTCNRTEVYAVVADAEAAREDLRRAVFEPRAKGMATALDGALYFKGGRDAVVQLYRVATGLDSLVLGEQQILGQVKHAYQLAQHAQCVGSVFHRMVNGAFRVGKRARAETAIGHGSVSVASIAVDLSEKVFSTLEGQTALIVGAGKNGRVSAEHLVARNIGTLLVTNRTPQKAVALAELFDGELIPFERLSKGLARADVVVCTTSAPEPVIHPEMVHRAMRKRGQKALVLLDIAVPRDVSVAVDDLPNVFRFDLDALEDMAQKNVAVRRREIPAVEKMVAHEADKFMSWWANLDASPIIRDLHKSFEEIRSLELGRNSKRFDEQDRDQLDLFSKTLTRKLLMGITQEIKSYSRDNPIELERLAAIRDVFHLSTETDEPGDGGREDDGQ